MKYSTKLSDTIHILIFIALGDDEQLSSTKIAESIKTNPAYVRQLMATLKNAGIVVNTQGHANAALAKSADKINMYDIYRAVEGDKPLLHLDTDTNPPEEQNRAFSDAVIRIKDESLKERNRTWDPTDIQGLQELVKAKKELEELGRKRQQLHISFE